MVGKFAGILLSCLALASAAAAPPELTLQLRDYLTMPDPGKRDPRSQNFSAYSRANMLREEPGPDRGRLFISDLDGPMYILDKTTKKLTTYLDFNGKGDRKGIFHRLVFETGWASGLFGFQFDPDYRRNGRFYTVHMEDPAVAAPALPDNGSVPGLKTAGVSGHGTDRNSWQDSARMRAHRVDRHEYGEYHVRRHRPRDPARTVQRHSSSHGWPDF